jgi:hypothetical protein
LAILAFATGAAVGALASNIARAYDAHYEAGFARIDGYSVDSEGRRFLRPSASPRDARMLRRAA